MSMFTADAFLALVAEKRPGHAAARFSDYLDMCTQAELNGKSYIEFWGDAMPPSVKEMFGEGFKITEEPFDLFGKNCIHTKIQWR